MAAGLRGEESKSVDGWEESEKSGEESTHTHNTGALPAVCEAERRCQPRVSAQHSNAKQKSQQRNNELRNNELRTAKRNVVQTKSKPNQALWPAGSIVGAGIQKIQAALPEFPARFESRLGF